MTNAKDQPPLVKHFLEHSTHWAALLLLGWVILNALVNATTTLMEARRGDLSLLLWEPFCWEITSAIAVYSLFWPVAFLIGRWPKFPTAYRLRSWSGVIFAHLLILLMFSIVHVSAMVALRKVWYALFNSQYDFGHLGYEFLYELRKDTVTYLTIIIVVSAYRFIVRRLQGEASLLHQSENIAAPLSDKFLIKTLGKEFLIAIDTIDWVEAAGNYANLHVGDRVFPMRITMTKLAETLPQTQFIRIHRSTIVNIECIKHIQALEMGDYEVSLHNGTKLNLSRRYRDNVKKMALNMTIK